MKKYEKPCLTAISLSGNDQLCGSCANGTVIQGNDTLGKTILWASGRFGQINDGITKSDFEGLFGLSENCEQQIDSYCKYGSVDEGLIKVAWS